MNKTGIKLTLHDHRTRAINTDEAIDQIESQFTFCLKKFAEWLEYHGKYMTPTQQVTEFKKQYTQWQ